MSLKQFHICLIYEQEDQDHPSKSYGQMIETDLVDEGLQPFLNKIPASIKNLMLWVTIVDSDGSENTFIDGMSPSIIDGERKFIPFEQLSNHMKASLRRQAQRMERTRLENKKL